MIAIGAQYYAADGDSGRRQARSRASLLALHDVIPINLQFVDDKYDVDGFRNLPVLRQDSRTVTGAAGIRKPIVSEMFGALAEAARAGGCRYFAYLNSDIEVTQAALERVLAGGGDGYAFSRTDLDASTGAELDVQIFGLDMFAVDAAWWAREAKRFRPYITAEGFWDDVYASIICGHGRGEIVNERPGIYHQSHPMIWDEGPFKRHNGYLAALDAPYFSRWCQYATRLDDARKAGVVLDRQRLADETLRTTRLSAGETVHHAARQLRARFNHARRRAGLE